MPTPPTPRAHPYIPSLDGIRAIAFLLVFGAHALPGYSYFIPATLGVTIFFFLSGYLITTLLRRELATTGTLSLRRFYLRRTLRIFVPLYLVYALAAAFAHFALHDSVGNRLGLFALVFYWYNYAMALGLRAWVPLGLNVIWSLSVEEHFYLLFPPLLLWLTRRRTTTRAFARGILLFCAAELLWRVTLIAVLHQHTLWTYYATDARLDSILFGCLLALTHNPVFNDPPLIQSSATRPAAVAPLFVIPGAGVPGKRTCLLGWEGNLRSRRLPLPSITPRTTLILALTVLILSLLPRSYLYRESLRYTLQGLALYVIFHYLLTPAHRHRLRWLEFLPLRYLGWISYVLYLTHEFILDSIPLGFALPAATAAVLPAVALTAAALPAVALLLRAALGLAIAVTVATLFRYTVELPLQRLRARLTPNPSTFPASTPL